MDLTQIPLELATRIYRESIALRMSRVHAELLYRFCWDDTDLRFTLEDVGSLSFQFFNGVRRVRRGPLIPYYDTHFHESDLNLVYSFVFPTHFHHITR